MVRAKMSNLSSITSSCITSSWLIAPGLRTLARDEQGQDLVEYSLLLAFVCLAGAAAFIGMGKTTAGLWTTVNSRLAAANQSTS